MRGILICAAIVLVTHLAWGGERTKHLVPSSAKRAAQPCYVILPAGFQPTGKPVPLLVMLHSWSGDVEQRNEKFELAAQRRGWVYLFPNFGGINDHPEACGSEEAQQDILDAITWACAKYPIDKRRVYLTGESGGGHMTMLMASRHPEPFAAASAWVGISDLAAWHQLHAGDGYGEMLRKCCGGKPGDSAAVDQEYRARSPLTHLAGLAKSGLPLEIAAGVHDGHKGSVPIRQSLLAFNAIASAAGAETISAEELAQLSRPDGRLEKPRDGDEAEDKSFGRKLYLRRTAAACRVSIFEGGHEGLPEAALDWLAWHKKPE